MTPKTPCITGHRPQSLSTIDDKTENLAYLTLINKIENIIMILILKENVTHFISGMARGVDTWCAERVLNLKKKGFDITLECAIPCETQTIYWNKKDQKRYHDIVLQCDKITMVQNEYTRDCFMKRNKYLVDNTDFVIAVWNGQKSGGTYQTIEYARSKERPIILINPNKF